MSWVDGSAKSSPRRMEQLLALVLMVALCVTHAAPGAQADTRAACSTDVRLSPFSARCAAWSPVDDLSPGSSTVCDSRHRVACTTYDAAAHRWVDTICDDVL